MAYPNDQHTPVASTSFGRGWIPLERDIGMPGEHIPPALSFRHEWQPAHKLKFLDVLALQGNVRAACRAVGFSPEAAYRLRRREPVFAAAWSAALVLARPRVEEVLGDRAIEGMVEEIWHRGELVGTRRRHDPRLLLAHMGRLDKLASDDPLVQARAGRFDELLAVIAGEAVPEEMAPDDMLADGDMPERARGIGPRRGGEIDPLLPVSRARYVMAATDRAGAEARAAALAALLAAKRPSIYKTDDDPERGLTPEQRESLDVAEDDARELAWETAHAAYDAWLARAADWGTRAADTLVEVEEPEDWPEDEDTDDAEDTGGEDASGDQDEAPPYEVKSLHPPVVAPALRRARDELPADGRKAEAAPGYPDRASYPDRAEAAPSREGGSAPASAWPTEQGEDREKFPRTASTRQPRGAAALAVGAGVAVAPGVAVVGGVARAVAAANRNGAGIAAGPTGACPMSDADGCCTVS